MGKIVAETSRRVLLKKLMECHPAAEIFMEMAIGAFAEAHSKAKPVKDITRKPDFELLAPIARAICQTMEQYGYAKHQLGERYRLEQCETLLRIYEEFGDDEDQFNQVLQANLDANGKIVPVPKHLPLKRSRTKFAT